MPHDDRQPDNVSRKPEADLTLGVHVLVRAEDSRAEHPDQTGILRNFRSGEHPRLDFPRGSENGSFYLIIFQSDLLRSVAVDLILFAS